jgi:hypothetical protein
MHSSFDPRELQRITRLSKSSKGLYDNCPRAFWLSKLMGHKIESNPLMERGSHIHKFHEDLLNAFIIDGNNIILPTGFNVDGEHSECKKRIVDFHIDRWKRCVENCPENPKKYFVPIINEDQFFLHIKEYDIRVTGIPDTVCMGFDDTPLVVELKTGKPTMEKIEKYKKELVWYKLLVDRCTKFGKVERGIIYFPDLENYRVKCSVTEDSVEKLIRSVSKTKDAIVNDYTSKGKSTPWEALAEKDSCSWCGFNKICNEGREVIQDA